ncbi:MAG: 30S ribosomal protein S12 methylthiotransferase RimO [candidate division Zixibacteria bacterium]
MIEDSKTYFLVTLGCSKNQIDSEAIEVDLISAGMRRTEDLQAADLIIVNSCGFINDAKIETLDTIFELHAGRKNDSVLVMCGCLPARYDLQKSIDEIDIFLPSNEHKKLLPMLREAGWDLHKPKESVKRVKPSAPFGYIKISEGCDNFCSYCAIPYIKGAFASRSSEDILAEAKYLCREGAKEIVLIGQDTTSYGKDNGGESGLPSLFDRLSEIEGCEWIRLMYAHPAHLTDDTIAAISENKRLVKYIDLPLQHINDRILGSMNRRTDRRHIETVLKKLRSQIPGIVIRTTFIVGFPGETDNEFAELLDFYEETQIDNVGIFKYSVEDGTAAERLSGRLDDAIIEERYLTLLDLQNKISGETLKNRVGLKERVLLHEIDSDGKAYGRAWFQAPEVDGQVIVENCDASAGDFVNVIFERSDAYDLYGSPVKGKNR